MKYLPYVAFALLVMGCHTQGENTADVEENAQSESPYSTAQVEVWVLTPSAFDEQIQSNGILEPRQKADVRWKTSETVTKVCVKEGDRVNKGALIAQLDDVSARQALALHEEAMERAMLDMKDFLLGQGYEMDDTAHIPAQILKVARIRSGYNQAELAVKEARRNLDACQLRAPIAGLVAELNVAEHNLVTQGQLCCQLLDNSRMTLTFPLMENEVTHIGKGTPLTVSLFSDEGSHTEGSVASINPLVDERGMMRVQADISEVPDTWFAGMKARVLIHRQMEQALVVPKQAVVERDGKHVAFTVKKGRAFWNYVELEGENSGQYVVKKGLTEGDTLIVSGNKYLAHLSMIAIQKMY